MKTHMIDKEFCMSSWFIFRYIIENDIDFFNDTYHRVYNMLPEEAKIIVNSEIDVDIAINRQFEQIKNKRLGLLLSGGMDSACLASYMESCEAYTFRFMDGNYQSDELKRAEYYAKKYNMNLHYVDIDWNTVNYHLDDVIKHKGAPVHSIEPQIYQAALQAKQDGVELMIIGDAADYVFGGMDGLYSKDWLYEEFKKRYTYLNPSEILVNPVDLDYAFSKYKTNGNKIDFISFMHEFADEESYASYENALSTADLPYLDPYEILKMGHPIQLDRIRNGESKYIIRALFKMKYPELSIPEKLPMPRPVDEYFKSWKGPCRPEFRKDIVINKYTGNQKWQMFCLEKFLKMYDVLL